MRKSVAGLLLVFGLPLVPALPALAHGEPDQSTTGGPAGAPCSAAEYPGTKLLATSMFSPESRQSFVPTRGGIASVELCIGNLVGILGTDFTVKIYSGGTSATNPGQVIASVDHDAGTALLADQWVHVDFPTEVPTTPGALYVIGLAPKGTLLSPVSFQWRATCSDSLLSSCNGVPDAYPQGETNDLAGNSDYAFRTFPLHSADLIGAVTMPSVVCPGLDLAGRATGTVTNVSETSVGAFAAQWLWSTDPSLDAGDQLIGNRVPIAGLAANASAPVTPPVLPSTVPLGRGHLLLQVDPDHQVVESDITNNVAAGPTTVTECGQPNISGLSLTIDETQVQTGWFQRQFTGLDPAALATLPQSAAEAEQNPAAAANGFSANGFSPNGFSANGFSPAGGVLLSSLLADLPAGIADQIMVVDVPGLETVIAPLIDTPIQDVTLARALQVKPDLTLGQADISRALSFTAMGLAFANAPLNSLGQPDGQPWCTYLAARGFDCAALGIDPASTSLLRLEAAGFPSFQLSSIATTTLAQLAVDPNWAVLDLPLAATPPWHVEYTRLGQVRADVALTDPSTVLDCVNFDCSRPLADAAAANAFKSVTVATLVANLSATGRGATRLADLGMGVMPMNALALARANWNLANAYQIDNACPQMTYHLRGTNTGTAAAVEPTMSATLAPGFAIVPGSVTLTHDGGAATVEPNPSTTVASDGVRTYTFQVDQVIGGAFDLTFRACANVYTGSFGAGSGSVSGVGIDGPYSSSTTSTDVIDVGERTPGVTTTPITPADNAVIFDHIDQANGFDSYTYPVQAPGTVTIFKLYNPIGIDNDLIGYLPTRTASGFSANGFSPNGFSANGFSPNGFSANGFSPNGFSANGFSANGFSANGFSSTTSPDQNDDIPIEELMPSGSSGFLVSGNRGDTSETLYMFSSEGDEGNFTISVADYNGSRGGPYVLTVQTIRPNANAALANCAAAPWDLTQTPGAAPSIPAGSQPRTLFITNRQVTASAYGAAAADAGIAALQGLAARPEVNGVVVNVDSNVNVGAAYADWRANWCSPTKATAVATQIRSVIVDLRNQYPSIDTIVLAGGDAIVPDFRLPDNSPMGNEVQYTDALLRATRTNNPTVSAFANRMLMSADPYGNEDPVAWGQTLAFPPNAGISRLVEGPNDWIAQRDRYVASNGTLDPQDGLVTAYGAIGDGEVGDGMVDGAKAAAAVLSGSGVSSRGGIPTTLLTDETAGWDADDFRSAAFTAAPDVAGYNAHANHFSILSDLGSDTNTADLVRTSELAGIPLGSMIFSNGCHFGTEVSDLLNASPDASESPRLLDWAQAISQRQGIAVANTGFGIFDTVNIGQGELLQVQYLRELRTAPNASVALIRAKNRFLATAGIYDDYTYKTVHQLTMYGLGIFKMLGATDAPAPTPLPDAPSINVSVGPFSLATSSASTCTDCYVPQQTPSGTNYNLRTGNSALEPGHTSTSGYWAAPTSVRQVALPPGRSSAGLWITGIQSVGIADVDAVQTRLALSRPDREIEPQTASPFPTSFGTSVDVGRTAYVTLTHGIASPVRMVNGQMRSDIQLYTQINAELMLRNEATIGCIPNIDEVTAARAGSLAVIDVVASELCGPNTRGAALVRVGTAWVYGEMAKAANGHWSVSIPVPSTTTQLDDVHIEVFNGRGVGHDRLKGDRVPLASKVNTGVDLQLSGTQHTSGVYLGSIQATIVGSTGVTYTVYDGDHLIGTFTSGQTFTISGDGAHDISVSGTDGSRYRNYLAIDGSSPVVTWTSPPNGASYPTGTQVPMTYTVSDTGTGATCTATNDGQPIANGALINTATVGTHTLALSCADQVGHTTTLTSRSYTVTSQYVISNFLSPIKAKPLVNNVSANSNITLKFTVTQNGQVVSDPSVIGSRQWYPINCQSKARTGSAFSTVGTTPEFSGGNFHFNTNTPGTVGCYELVVTLVDGSWMSAYFQVKK